MTVESSDLGRLERVELRSVWINEARDFTPWLVRADNLQLLGKAIGMDLEPEVHEQSVGRYRADILCRDTGTESWVLIENQLERTDHSHLGQLLTYAAGLNAVSIVWVAERFTEEHRAALDWLNEKTPEEINFFGLEVELWRIGNSPVAPKFNVISKPNEWTRAVIRSRDNSESRQYCWDYWSGVFEEIRPTGILSESATPFYRHDTNVDVGWQSFKLKAYFSRPRKCGGVWVSCRGPRSSENYDALRASSAAIEREFGSTLTWNGDGDNSDYSCTFTINNIDVDDENDRARQQRLFAEKLVALYLAVKSVVGPLDANTGDSSDG